MGWKGLKGLGEVWGGEKRGFMEEREGGGMVLDWRVYEGVGEGLRWILKGKGEGYEG